MSLIQYFQEPFLSLHDNGILEFNLNVHSLIVLAGGVFIIYTAIKEIWHMMLLKEHEETDKEDKKGSINKVILWIVIMNLVFSFDSILSAMALTSDMDYVPQLILMSIAIILGGVLMIVLADKVSNFLQKNRMYEVLGLFILFIVGIMLLSEGGHLAHLHIFNNEVTQMSKTTFYFVIVVLVIVDIVQGRYQKKLLAEKEHQEALAEKESKDLLADKQEK